MLRHLGLGHGHPARSGCPVIYDPLPTQRQLFDQNFAQSLCDDDILPYNWFNGLRPQRLHSAQESGRSQIECTKDKFEVKLDVQHFGPDEIDVKVVEDCVVINGKHVERPDQHGYISREFTRKYHLPKDVKAEDVTCNLSSDGVLFVTAKRHPALPAPEDKAKSVPIVHTGKPAAADVSGRSCCPVNHAKNQHDQKNGAEKTPCSK